MSLSLKVKTERAFAEYIPTVITVGALNIYEGHTPSDENPKAMPALVIYAENAEINPDLPPEMGIKNVLLRARFYVDSASGGRTALDAWKKELEEQMRTVADIKTALNKPAGTDTRTYKAIHFHDVIPSDDVSDQENTDWQEELAWTVIVEPQAT